MTELLRIVGHRPDEQWTVLLNALCHRMSLPYSIERERAGEVELVLQGPLTQIEALGQDILDGALGFTPQAVSIQKQQSIPYFLRRKPNTP